MMKKTVAFISTMVILLTVVMGITLQYTTKAAADEALTFSYDSGYYGSSINLSITSTSGGTIYYTTDGSVPVPKGASTSVYSSAIPITNKKGTTPILSTSSNAYNFVDGRNAYTPNSSNLDRATIIRH